MSQRVSIFSTPTTDLRPNQKRLISVLLAPQSPPLSAQLVMNLCDNDAQKLLALQQTLVFRERNPSATLLAPTQNDFTDLCTVRDLLSEEQKELLDGTYYAMKGQNAHILRDFVLRDHKVVNQERICDELKCRNELEGWNSSIYAWEPPLTQVDASASQASTVTGRNKRKREILEMRGKFSGSSLPESESPDEKKRKTEIIEENVPEEFTKKIISMRTKLSSMKDKDIAAFLRANSTHLTYILTHLNFLTLKDVILGKVSKDFVKRSASYESACIFLRLIWLAKVKEDSKKMFSRFIVMALKQICKEHPQAALDAFLIPLLTGPEAVPLNKNITSLATQMVAEFPRNNVAVFLTHMIDELPQVEWSDQRSDLLHTLMSHSTRPLTTSSAGGLLVHLQSGDRGKSAGVLLRMMMSQYVDVMKPHVNLLEGLLSSTTDMSLVALLEQVKKS